LTPLRVLPYVGVVMLLSCIRDVLDGLVAFEDVVRSWYRKHSTEVATHSMEFCGGIQDSKARSQASHLPSRFLSI